MIPIFSLNNSTECGAWDSHYFRQSMCINAIIMELSRIGHNFFGQFCARVLFSPLVAIPSLPRSVSIIIKICSKPKVVRIYTCAIITFMQNAKAIWNRADMNTPTYPMRPIALFSFFSGKGAISALLSSFPLPAVICFMDKFKKSLDCFRWELICKLFLHKGYLLLSRLRPLVWRGGFLVPIIL